MIDLCYEERPVSKARPYTCDDFVAELKASGLTFQRVDRPRPHSVCLLFAGLASHKVTNASAEERTRIVLVAEGDEPSAEDAGATREALGLLGLVEPRAWSSWQRGLYVTWGLFGRPDIASAAGLVMLGAEGLQASNGVSALPVLLARFLKAAL